ncbi:MAG TPA: tRNA pseudouridine(13) synthase TruD [Polyangiales bacterium]|nr:tRNA pseudouridine(13) synthase TruD [Polyangiales bacterium]
MHARVTELPYATAKSLSARGKIRSVPEDFRVEELPAYPPSGQGEHVFVHFEKTRLTTQQAVERIASTLGVDARAAGVAGQKDKIAVTTQWASFTGTTPEAVRALELPGIRVLDASRHGNKLRTGHLRGNRFELRLRGTTRADVVSELMAQLSRIGVPNYYGEQRFGIGERNVERALQFVAGEAKPPRDRFQRKLLFSALQSALFNAWLAARIERGQFERPLLGDVLRKEDTGGLFVNEDQADAERRMQAWEVSPTGPMFGAEMRAARGEALAYEEAVLADAGLSLATFARHVKLGAGTRRSARIRPAAWRVCAEEDAVHLAFELPPGAYATAVLREITKDAEQPPDGREPAG